jgi:murein L,D-transpeptidase YafK
LSQEWGGHAQGVLDRLDGAEALATWNRWIEETVAWSRRRGEPAIIVDKAERTLLFYDGGRLIRSFAAELGRNPVADKLREGDNATPEGKYRITEVRSPGQTRFHRAFMLDYPNSEDWTRFKQARREGRIPGRSAIGGLIEIHGHGGRGDDWTNGCVALTNAEMDFLASRVRTGTPVTIVGARRPRTQRPGESTAAGGR